MHTAPGAHSKHAHGVVCISNMILEQIRLRKFFQIINDHMVLEHLVQDHMILDHKSRQKSPKSFQGYDVTIEDNTGKY